MTRVGLNSSTFPGSEGGDAAAGGFCAVGNKVQFEIVVAFDAAPPSPNGENATLEAPGEEAAEGEGAEAEPPAPEPEAETATGEAAASVTGAPAG